MINLGLERTSRLLQHIALKCFNQTRFRPPWKVVHIAGTNGKGSGAAYITAFLHGHKARDGRDRPLRVGRFTSPHFIDRWDCIQIDNQPVSREIFLATEARVKAIANDVERELRVEAEQNTNGNADIERDVRITEFELLTATAFTLFSEDQPCDIAVVECGLGGRLDATNVLPDDSIALSVITRIGLDHLEMLGGSLESIVREKCGIMRPGVPVIVDGDNTSDVLNMIQHEFDGKDMHTELTRVTQKSFTSRQQNDVLSELLPHQRTNLAVAQEVFEKLSKERLVQHDASQQTSQNTEIEQVVALANATYPGRLQVLKPGWLDETPEASCRRSCNQVEIVLDGAHNAQSAEVLAEFIDKKVQERQIDKTSNQGANGVRPDVQDTVIYIIAMSSKKSAEEILRILFASATSRPLSTALIIFTQFGPVDGMPWVAAKDSDELRSIADQLGLHSSVVGTCQNIKQALGQVDQVLTAVPAGSRPLLVVTGSLYLISDFLRYKREG